MKKFWHEISTKTRDNQLSKFCALIKKGSCRWNFVFVINYKKSFAGNSIALVKFFFTEDLFVPLYGYYIGINPYKIY